MGDAAGDQVQGAQALRRSPLLLLGLGLQPLLLEPLLVHRDRLDGAPDLLAQKRGHLEPLRQAEHRNP